MTLTVMKHGGSWDSLAHMFQVKAPTFIRLISGFMQKLYPHAVERYVHKPARESTLASLRQERSLFSNFPYACEAIDVTFQHANRPSGNMQEGKVYFSGKHKLYGFKVEVAVRPNGMASAFSRHYPGSVSDLSILLDGIDGHLKRTEKQEDDDLFHDSYHLHEQYPNQWAVLLDKGYQGAADTLRAITPRKKPVRGMLSREDEVFNKKLSSDRILVENYFGRLGQLWGLLGKKYVWSEKLFDTVFSLGVAFTNFHISMHKLRDVDGDWFTRYKKRLNCIGETSERKRAES